jgi:transcriptional regulator with PAS, ATPase and Fis domain
MSLRERVAGPGSRMQARAREAVFGHLVGASPAMREVLNTADKAAETDANVYIYGENGTGKELVARAIHYRGARRGKPLITLDCTAIPEGLMESQLFGHVRGAFTGAVDSQEGVFALAHSGTLFIDEIGELSLPLQAKLLRVLQFREYTPVGGAQSRRVDARFITATNRDLRQAVQAGTFRSDLFYRIAVVHIVIPALRERRQDIPLLVDHFLKKFAAQYQRPVRQVSPAVRDFFQQHAWPGNVRQLENCIEHGVIFAQGETLELEDLRGFFEERVVTSPSATPPSQPSFSGSLKELEEWYILETLKRFSGNRTRTARFLGLSLRSLQYKLKRYHLKRR